MSEIKFSYFIYKTSHIHPLIRLRTAIGYANEIIVFNVCSHDASQAFESPRRREGKTIFPRRAPLSQLRRVEMQAVADDTKLLEGRGKNQYHCSKHSPPVSFHLNIVNIGSARKVFLFLARFHVNFFFSNERERKARKISYFCI